MNFNEYNFHCANSAPADIQLHPIKTHGDLEKANSVWPFRNPNSLVFFERIAKYNPNIGAYKVDGTMVAWLLRYFWKKKQNKGNNYYWIVVFLRLPTGLLGALQTDEKYFGHGYGTLVTKVISKKIAELGHDIYAGILEKNYPSRNLFSKLGFKSIGEVHWITTKINWTEADEWNLIKGTSTFVCIHYFFSISDYYLD